MQAQETERLWDAEDVAQFLGVARTWVYEQVRHGRGLPFRRIPGSRLVRFVPSEIRAWAVETKVAE